MAILGLDEKEYFARGHRACAGCGEALALRLAMKVAGENTVVVQCTGCMEVVSTPYPETAWEVPWVHGAFENNASIASGVERALKVLGKEDVNVMVLGGDGGTYDIGFRGLSGAFERGHNITYICTDNEAYMNTGIQRSGATPYGASTTTSPAGKVIPGKEEQKKDLVSIIAAHGSPYVATASVGYHADLVRKVKTALETKGPTFVNIYSPCVPGWRTDPAKSITIAKLGVETGATPLFEIIDGKHVLNMPQNPENLKPVEEYLKLQGRFRHLFRPEKNEEILSSIEAHAKENLKRIKELAEKGC
ncbi:MAG: pyruvate synthase subunit beta [Candidatus Altiarchaeales archaeon]|nr:pyruvate synthase subunit beta [Candidatus Altiarchaeales archaeon]MBD3416694.1 pyruvate synthase subunit beta [Candidatus Altiarchaeales archaeon]